MPTTIVKISELVEIPVSGITTDDFIPLVDSGSLTTFRVSVGDFSTYYGASGSARTSSYADYAVSTGTADTASYVLNAVSASYANTSSYSFLAVTSSYTINALTASYVDGTVIAQTANELNYPNNSRAKYSDLANEALYLRYSPTNGTASAADYAKTSSIAHTASYMNPTNHPGLIKAWANFTSSAGGILPVGTYYNISSITKQSIGLYTLNFSPNLPSTNYMVLGYGIQPDPANGMLLVGEYFISGANSPATKSVSQLQICSIDADESNRDFEYGSLISVAIIGM